MAPQPPDSRHHRRSAADSPRRTLVPRQTTLYASPTPGPFQSGQIGCGAPPPHLLPFLVNDSSGQRKSPPVRMSWRLSWRLLVVSYPRPRAPRIWRHVCTRSIHYSFDRSQTPAADPHGWRVTSRARPPRGSSERRRSHAASARARVAVPALGVLGSSFATTRMPTNASTMRQNLSGSMGMG